MSNRAMADAENLNKFRKERMRAEARQLAKENRARHGRSGAEKARDRAEKERADHRLEAMRLAPRKDLGGD